MKTLVRSWATKFAVALVIAGSVACSEEYEEGPRTKSGASSAEARATKAPRTAQAALDAELNPRLLRRFQALTGPIEAPHNVLSEPRVKLGKKLFFETKLSKAGDLSCNSCHDLASYGVDGKRTSTGHKGQVGARNSPTVFNSAAAFAQFWDGRARTVEEQATGPILNPVEMAMDSAEQVVGVLKASPDYVKEFAAAFPASADPVTFENVGIAIGAFERTLVTPSRWDKFLSGDKDALSLPEKQGLKTFLNVGCMVCHTGVLLGGSMFQRAGAVEPWPNQQDTGRMSVTKAVQDKMMFKVPTLRNIEKTAPYFHDGSAATLEQAISVMGKHQLGLDLSPAEVKSIAIWMKSLTGELPK